MSEFVLDHPFVVMAVVAVVAILVSLGLQRIVHSAVATVANGVLIIVLITIPMNHLFALSRDRDNERRALRSKHLEELEKALQRDSSTLAEVARKVSELGTMSFSSNDSDLKDMFYRDAISIDLANHFPEYFQQKEKLRSDAVDQDREDKQATLRAMKMLPSHINRQHIARSIMSNCRGLGGMTLQIEPNLYIFSWGAGSSSSPVGGSPPRELIETFEIYKAFSPDSQTAAECQTLKTRAARIVENARKLGEQAKSLAATSTLTGDCAYVRLP